jgi:hypothetical protein
MVRVAVVFVNRHRNCLHEDAGVMNRERVNDDRPSADGLRVGFTFREMATRVPTDLLTITDDRPAIHAVNFASLVRMKRKWRRDTSTACHSHRAGRREGP